MIRPSRGDRKPCTVPGCAGTMQFGRRTGSIQQLSGHSDGVSGWSCDGGTEPTGGVLRGGEYLTLVPRHDRRKRDSTAPTGDACNSSNGDDA